MQSKYLLVLYLSLMFNNGHSQVYIFKDSVNTRYLILNGVRFIPTDTFYHNRMINYDSVKIRIYELNGLRISQNDFYNLDLKKNELKNRRGTLKIVGDGYHQGVKDTIFLSLNLKIPIYLNDEKVLKTEDLSDYSDKKYRITRKKRFLFRDEIYITAF